MSVVWPAVGAGALAPVTLSMIELAALVEAAALVGWLAAYLAGRPADPPRRRRTTGDGR